MAFQTYWQAGESKLNCLSFVVAEDSDGEPTMFACFMLPDAGIDFLYSTISKSNNGSVVSFDDLFMVMNHVMHHHSI